MNDYELKQERRRENLRNASEAANARSDQAFQSSKAILSNIVPGQPILVGHHSEGRHRRDLSRSDSAMRRSIEESQRAEELARRADSVGTGGISSDDPDALEKLRNKVAALKADQEAMKAANKAIRSAKTPEAKVAALVALKYDEATAQELIKPDFAGRIGFAQYRLTNNLATIKTTEKRIASLEAVRSLQTAEVKGEGYTYREDVEENRAMFLFPGKPDGDTISTLKSNGFKWSPNRGAWVRMLNGNAQWAGRTVRQWLASRCNQLN
jgi:hypothetical protein